MIPEFTNKRANQFLMLFVLLSQLCLQSFKLDLLVRPGLIQSVEIDVLHHHLFQSAEVGILHHSLSLEGFDFDLQSLTFSFASLSCYDYEITLVFRDLFSSTKISFSRTNKP